jgi:nicotinamide-nucleotide amidase
VEIVEEAERRTRAAAGEHIFGVQDDTLESVLVHEFTRRGLRLALAESCTGGHIANRITNIPGASAVLNASWVTYANEAKERLLDVPAELLREQGAVSEAVARAMAEGARRHAQSDYAAAVTGIAGPAGAVPGKPVGTVFIAIAGPDSTQVVRQLNAFDRETFKYLTAQQTMAILLRAATSHGPAHADLRS